ncbi:MAG TPA: ADOP family duplicated permease [Acidobacteriota bacterium]|nr:ADOP family duplicated permease [Acidobacteriota bacterium]
MLNGISSDLRASLRSLGQSPSFTVFAGLCLALGIGAAASVFTVFDAFVLRPLPFERPERLAGIWLTIESSDLQYFLKGTYLEELERQATQLEVAAAQPLDLNVSRGGGEMVRVEGAYASAPFFRVLGVRPLRGRFFTVEEEEREASVCLISEELWRGQWGGEEDMVGRSLLLSGREYEVAGIVPANRAYPSGTDIYIPMTRQVRQGRLGMFGIGRLKPGVTYQQARQELQAVARYMREKDPQANRERGIDLEPLNTNLSSNVRPTLYALLAGVGFLLAIACANVASLVLVRVRRQRPEIALRTALGASRARVLRRMLLENGVLTLAAGAVGVALAYASVPLAMTLSPVPLPDFKSVSVDLRVLAFSGAVTVLSLLLSSLVPALSAASRNAADSLRQADRGSSGGLRRRHKLLLTLDGALALLLITGAGMTARNFAALQSTWPGFDPANLVQMRVTASDAWAGTHQGRADFIVQVEESLAALPSVEDAGATHATPFTDAQYWMSFVLRDQPPEREGEGELAIFYIVTPGYFKTLGLPLVQGRPIQASDRQDSMAAVVVSQSLAQRYWPGESALGKQIKPLRAADDSWWTVVGVVADQRDRGLGEPEGPSFFVPHRQFERSYAASMNQLLRLRPGATGAIGESARKAVRSVDPQAVIYEMQSMEEILDESLSRERFSAVLSALFAALALILAAAGVYGVVSYGVVQRRPEMGIRLTFGARASDLRRMVVKDAMLPLLLGLGLGAAGALLLAGLLEEQLQAVQPHDPLTLMWAAAVLAAVSLLASYLPARRASRLDPVRTLRS